MNKLNLVSSQKNRDSLSFAITCVFFVLLFVIFTIIPISKQKKYTQISVQLDVPIKKAKITETQSSAEITEDVQSEHKTVAKETPIKSIDDTKEIQKQVQSQPKKETVTTQKVSTKTESTPTQPKKQESTLTKREVVYQKSVEELMAENAKKKKQTSSWDESLFSEDSSVVSSTNSKKEYDFIQDDSLTSSFEGVAASSSSSENIKTSSSGRSYSSDYGEVSSSTAQALNKISSTKYVTNNQNQTIAYETSGVQTPRQLLFPREPSITIPESLENKILRNRNVKISFVVKADGSVEASTITIEPLGSLVPELEAEIKEQIALWRFETGKSDGQAAFNYSIKVE